MSDRRRYPTVTPTTEEGFTPPAARIPPARQLCHGSNRELADRPKNDRCPVCERKLEIQEIPSGRRDPKTRDIVLVYVTPTHMMRVSA